MERFTEVATSRGLSRSEALRKAMEEFIARKRKDSMTSKMRGLVRSRFSLRELEELYLVFR